MYQGFLDASSLMRFVVHAVLRLVQTVLRVLVLLVCVVCAGGLAGAALAQPLLLSASAPEGAFRPANDSAPAQEQGPSLSEQQGPLSTQDTSDTSSSSTGSTSEEDDQNDAAGGELATLVERRTPQVVYLGLVCRQRPAEDNVAARDHSALEPRPPRA